MTPYNIPNNVYLAKVVAESTPGLAVVEVLTRASQNFRGYLPHSGLQSEWSGALLVAVSEG